MANGVAYECFDIADWQDDHQMTVTLETKNFELDTVKVWEANRLCQIAKRGAFHIVTAYPNQP